jgi:hypothetical protein
MNKKLILSGILVCLLIFSFGLIGCGGTTEAEDITTLKITGIPDSIPNGAPDFSAYVLVPPGTTKGNIEADISAGLGGGTTSYVIAGNSSDTGEATLTGSANNNTALLVLRTTASNWTAYWNGSGTYDIWFLLTYYLKLLKDLN